MIGCGYLQTSHIPEPPGYLSTVYSISTYFVMRSFSFNVASSSSARIPFSNDIAAPVAIILLVTIAAIVQLRHKSA